MGANVEREHLRQAIYFLNSIIMNLMTTQKKLENCKITAIAELDKEKQHELNAALNDINAILSTAARNLIVANDSICELEKIVAEYESISLAGNTGTASVTNSGSTSTGAGSEMDAGSSTVLRRNMIAAGRYEYANSAAHHIVGGNDRRAAPARAVLERFNIHDVNTAINGVFLPTRGGAMATRHRGRHSQHYIDTVNGLLMTAETREEAITILQWIAGELRDGRMSL